MAFLSRRGLLMGVLAGVLALPALRHAASWLTGWSEAQRDVRAGRPLHYTGGLGGPPFGIDERGLPYRHVAGCDPDHPSWSRVDAYNTVVSDWVARHGVPASAARMEGLLMPLDVLEARGEAAAKLTPNDDRHFEDGRRLRCVDGAIEVTASASAEPRQLLQGACDAAMFPLYDWTDAATLVVVLPTESHAVWLVDPQTGVLLQRSNVLRRRSR